MFIIWISQFTSHTDGKSFCSTKLHNVHLSFVRLLICTSTIFRKRVKVAFRNLSDYSAKVPKGIYYHDKTLLPCWPTKQYQLWKLCNIDYKDNERHYYQKNVGHKASWISMWQTVTAEHVFVFVCLLNKLNSIKNWWRCYRYINLLTIYCQN